MTLARSQSYGGLHAAQKDVSAAAIVVGPTTPPADWQIVMTRPGGGNLAVDPITSQMEVEDLILVLGYEWE